MSVNEAQSDTMLTDFLATRDAECPLCRYNLRGLHGNHCPECGHELVLQVALTDPVRGAYLAGLIGLACAFGFNTLLLILFAIVALYQSVMRGGVVGGPPLSFWSCITGASIVSGILLRIWVRKATAIRRRPKQQRITLAALGCAVPVLSMAVLALIIFATT